MKTPFATEITEDTEKDLKMTSFEYCFYSVSSVAKV